MYVARFEDLTEETVTRMTIGELNARRRGTVALPSGLTSHYTREGAQLIDDEIAVRRGCPLYGRVWRKLPPTRRDAVRTEGRVRTDELLKMIDAQAARHVACQEAILFDGDIANRSAHMRAASMERELHRMAASLAGGPWHIETQGRGGGIGVVLSLADDRDAGDGVGGGWNIGVVP